MVEVQLGEERAKVDALKQQLQRLQVSTLFVILNIYLTVIILLVTCYVWKCEFKVQLC